METIPEESSLALRDYLDVLWLRKGTVFLVTAIVTACALIYSFRQTPLFESEAKVLVKSLATTTSPGVAAGLPPNLETEKEVAASESVAELAAQRLPGEETPRKLLGGLTVEAPIETEVLIFNYTLPDPEEAQRRAQAFAQGYLEYRRQQAVDELLASSQTYDQRLEALEKQLDGINQKIAKSTDQLEKSRLEADRSLLTSQIAVLQGELFDLRSPDALSVGQVVEPAALPASPTSPNHPRNAVLGAIFGLAFGIGVAFLREHLDDRLRGRADLTASLGAPVLAVIPRIPGAQKGVGAVLTTVSKPRSTASEAYRTLRTGVLFTSVQRGAKTVMITSPHAGEGKTSTTANLGVALAQAGKRVILISADLRKPLLHRFFEVDYEPGLTNVLAGEIWASQALANSKVENLWVLSSGAVPGNPAELLGSDAMGRLLTKLRNACDFILVDCPPVLAVSDAITLAPLTDGVLLVADSEKTTRSALELARQQLEQVDAQILGSVLNKFDPSRARGYGYGYGYHSKYGYGTGYGYSDEASDGDSSASPSRPTFSSIRKKTGS